MHNENTLAHLGFSLAEANSLNLLAPVDRFAKLGSNLEAYELHVARDQVVSTPSHYYLSHDKRIFTDRNETKELYIDREERGGFYSHGITQAVEDAIKNPYRLIFLYSPTGPASFDSNPNTYSEITYDIGQLSLLYFDGIKTVSLSISIDKEGESWLNEVLNDFYRETNSISEKKERIIQFITTPVVSDFTIDSFLDNNWSNRYQHIFLSQRGREYTLDDVLFLVRESLAGRLRGKINTELIAAQLAFNGGYISKSALANAYNSVTLQVMDELGVKHLALGGGCGGTIAEADELTLISRLEQLLPNLSSQARLIAQGNLKELLKKSTENRCSCGEKEDPRLFHCPMCHKNSVPPVGYSCPQCKKTLEDGKKLGVITKECA